MILLIFKDWQSFVEITLITLGFAATVYSIYKNTDSIRTNLLHDMNKEERALSMKLFEITNGIKNKENKNKKILKIQKEILITQHLNFFEHLALLINQRKINGKLAKKYYKTLVLDAITNYKGHIFPKYTELIKLYKKWK